MSSNSFFMFIVSTRSSTCPIFLQKSEAFDDESICPCINDVNNNGILEEMKEITLKVCTISPIMQIVDYIKFVNSLTHFIILPSFAMEKMEEGRSTSMAQKNLVCQMMGTSMLF